MYLALVPDDRKHARLFIVGRKQMPEIRPGESHPSERHWLLLSEIGTPAEIGTALRPVRYETKTKGERQTPQAIPVGIGPLRHRAAPMTPRSLPIALPPRIARARRSRR